MAPKVTSSSGRSKGSTSKPVTKGQNPQRANRQAVSRAQVSSDSTRTRNGGARITNASERLNNGSARVTGTQSQAPKALPPGRQGGPLATTPSRRDAAMNRQTAAAQGSSGNGVRTVGGSTQRALPPASNRQPGTTRTAPTRRETAQYRQRIAEQGSTSSEVRVGNPAPGTTPSRAARTLGAAGRLAGAVGTGLTIAEVLGGVRRAFDSANADQKRQRLAKTLPQMSPDQMRNAVRLGQASPEDVGNPKARGSVTRAPKAPNAPKPAGTQPSTPAPRSTQSAPTYGAVSGGSGYQGVSGRVSSGVRGTSPMGSSTPMRGTPASESYRDGGKGLYQGSEAYRAAMKAKDPNSSGNPLLDRMRSTMASANYASQRQDEATGTARVNPYAKGLDLAGNTKPIAPTMGQLPGAPKINPYATGLQLAPSAKPAKQSDTQIAAKPKKDERKPRATTSRPTRNR